MTTSPDFREASSSYCRVIHTEDRHRVAICRDGIQYLLQRQYTDKGNPSWRSLRFCATARALCRDWGQITGLPVPTEVTILPDARNAPAAALGAYMEAAQAS